MPKKTWAIPGDEDTAIAEDAFVAPEAVAEVDEAVFNASETLAESEIPVTAVTEVEGRWRLQWTDAVGRLHQSWSPDRLETSTLSHLAGLPPYGDDLESVLVDICVPVSMQVATLHHMNIWETKKITYQAMRDILASQGAAEFIALEARVQALGAQKG